MKILIINAGSSSLKYQLIDMQDESVIAKGLVERIGINGSNLSHKYGDGQKFDLAVPLKDHTEAMNVVLDALQDADHGVIKNLNEIGAVGHRVLHGGEKFSASCLIDDAVIAAVEENIPLGPLHNPANLMGIRACQKVLPNVPQVAVFDTAFHQTMPAKAYRYALPKRYYTELHMRKYGFHGTSHRFIAGRAAELMGRGKKVIVCHLGNGSSLSACVDGKCVDTTMGITPLDGLVMGTRCGTLDPACVEFIANTEKKTVSEVLNMMNKQSGLLGLAGSSDMRDVNARLEAGDEDAKLALEMWTYTIQKYIGSYIAAMNGCDAIIFTAGIGENDARARQWVCDGLSWFGVKIDEAVNAATRSEARVSAADSKIQVWVIPTNEELAIARDTLEIATKK
ncbi:MAG: acetate kinase [Christensenellales bacterium]|nr:acetate kinase [Christensenellales bacterium]